jgi:hypothetical protein
MPPRTSIIDDNSTKLIKDMYLIILGLGFTFIVQDLMLTGYGLYDFVTKLIYFLGLYYFLSYDWIAYTLIINRYPYSMTESLKLRYQGRFYADLSHLLIKSGLIFLALRTLDYVTLAFASGLFALWHIAIVGWHLFAQYEYDQYKDEVNWEIHWVMFPLYLLLGSGILILGNAIALRSNSIALVVILMVIVVGFSTYRKRDLIEQLRGEHSDNDTGKQEDA